MAALSVLLVEDEAIVAILLEELLLQAGAAEVVIATTLETALARAEVGEFSLAVLDINLDGATSYPVADVLDRRGVPYVFSTGYDRRSLDPRFAHCQLISKPCSAEDIRRAIARVIDMPPAGD